MELEEAVKEFDTIRKECKVLRDRMFFLNKIIEESGGHPRYKDRISRNKQFYKLWKSGWTYIRIAEKFKVAHGTVGIVCRLIDRSLKNRGHVHYETYKDLKEFKRET